MLKRIGILLIFIVIGVFVISGCSDVSYVKVEHLDKTEASQGPGERDTWAKAQKQGIGTANNDVSKVWPKKGQERWEEAGGYSPATMAAEVAGLVCAADIAKQNKDMERTKKYLETADKWQELIDKLTYTTKGPYGNGQYYIRIAGLSDPDADFLISIANGRGQNS